MVPCTNAQTRLKMYILTLCVLRHDESSLQSDLIFNFYLLRLKFYALMLQNCTKTTKCLYISRSYTKLSRTRQLPQLMHVSCQAAKAIMNQLETVLSEAFLPFIYRLIILRSQRSFLYLKKIKNLPFRVIRNECLDDQ